MLIQSGRGQGRKISLKAGRVELVRSENAWKPHSLNAEQKAGVDAMHKQLAGDLNKLTPERFESISTRMRETLLKLDADGLPVFVSELLSRVRESLVSAYSPGARPAFVQRNLCKAVPLSDHGGFVPRL